MYPCLTGWSKLGDTTKGVLPGRAQRFELHFNIAIRYSLSAELGVVTQRETTLEHNGIAIVLYSFCLLWLIWMTCTA
ncbi:hypothetical protein CDL12_06943 [Handroanthus impetiginosus]|uniref:Uncharacterized protein n=1 Tax=Handroanthus impetiginosus TaxID=429701 RepID=A0A2G9HS56_9LAMI|nr:hypothetical protein CDL12_06943 [Handroanthus impetiginosus]